MHKVFVFALLVLGAEVGAQTIGTSPYAAFGIGDVKYENDLNIRAMGGISAAYISDYSNSFNFDNPAANFNLELTSLKGQVSNENVHYKSDFNNYNQTKHSTYMSEISIALPLSSKVKFGMNFQPYSSKNYAVRNTTMLADSIQQVSNFTGNGTISRVGAALSYQIVKGFGIGFKTNFNFGKVTDLQEVAFTNAPLISGYATTSKLKSFNFTAGAAYQHTSKSDHKFTAGATYTFGNTGTMRTQFTNSTYFYSGVDKKDENIIESFNGQSKNLLPQQFQLGIGYGTDLRWFTSAQIDYQKGRVIDYLGQPFQYNNSYRAMVGGWFVPNVNDFRSYFNRVLYRYGVFYEKGDLNINGTDINSYGVSAGVNLPIKPAALSFSSIDISLEVGKRGTLQNNLVKEGFFNLKFGFNFGNRWFVRQVFQ